MSMFWKPVVPGFVDPRDRMHFKVLGSGYYQLWCRCDLCFMSGPSTIYSMFQRGEETGELCMRCAGNKLTVAELEADGWKFR